MWGEEMLLGIDVGGTFTDAVLIGRGQIIAQAKCKTTHEEVLRGILSALDEVLHGQEVYAIERVVISSTIVTNALTEGLTDSVFLAVMTGPGMNVEDSFPVKPHYVSGYIDHRGKVAAGVDFKLDQSLLKKADSEMAAVSGKFSVRNPENEYLLAKKMEDSGYEKIFLGSELSGELNFVRRTNSAYFSATVYKTFKNFCTQVQISLKHRNITAPVHILKADGGTLPLEISLNHPVEAIFTGPAASVLGIEALGAPRVKSISLDVGGTTTDIAFWDNGLPLQAKKGAKVAGYPTAVRSFYMRSIGVGGDSSIKWTDAGFKVGPERAGSAMAIGGSAPTLSDALIVAGFVDFGDKSLAKTAMQLLVRQDESEIETAFQIVAAAVSTIEDTINEMLREWELQPVYTVNDVIKGTEFKPELLIGVGGGASGLIRALGEHMDLPVKIPVGAMVANAVGAALARPTLAASLRADTTERYYLIPESGQREPLPSGFSIQMAENILASWLHKQAEAWQLPGQEVEVINKEFFRTIHDHYSSGEIISLRMQLKPGIIQTVAGREVAL